MEEDKEKSVKNIFDFHKSRHIQYCKFHLNVLPEGTETYDNMRMTLLFFAISSLDVLDSLDDILQSQRYIEIINWIYMLQVLPYRKQQQRIQEEEEQQQQNILEKQQEKSQTLNNKVDNISSDINNLKIINNSLLEKNEQRYTNLDQNEQINSKLKELNQNKSSSSSNFDINLCYDGCGFQGSSNLNFSIESNYESSSKNELSINESNLVHYRLGNIALTYSALCTLLILGDDLSKVNKKGILLGLKNLQQKSGSFQCTLADGDSDMRFVFCACSICYILNDWSAIDSSLCLDFILKSMSYDYGFAQGPNLESHGGSTYCAIASLVLMNKLDKLNKKQIEGLKRWLIFRQKSSFQGRPNKPEDTCYTFWIGASLSMLGVSSWIEEKALLNAVKNTQHTFGGFSKWPGTESDILHTYLGIAGLSLLQTNGFSLQEVYPALNITKRAFAHLKKIQKSW